MRVCWALRASSHNPTPTPSSRASIRSRRKSPRDASFFKREQEDIHLNIESRLTEIVGEAGARLHTARSRNDQVATDFRLWVRAACERAERGFARGCRKFCGCKQAPHAETIMPGFTHMQPAQPVSFAHHCLAYVEMFERDRSRFEDARKRHERISALAPPRWPERHSRSNREATGARAWLCRSHAPIRSMRFPRAISRSNIYPRRPIAAVHLFASRRRNRAVGFAGFRLRQSWATGFTTGSSIMPQKRNPDAGGIGCAPKRRAFWGQFVTLAGVMKGLALAYAKRFAGRQGSGIFRRRRARPQPSRRWLE